jgi:hypothetical protein
MPHARTALAQTRGAPQRCRACDSFTGHRQPEHRRRRAVPPEQRFATHRRGQRDDVLDHVKGRSAKPPLLPLTRSARAVPADLVDGRRALRGVSGRQGESSSPPHIVLRARTTMLRVLVDRFHGEAREREGGALVCRRQWPCLALACVAVACGEGIAFTEPAAGGAKRLTRLCESEPRRRGGFSGFARLAPSGFAWRGSRCPARLRWRIGLSRCRPANASIWRLRRLRR